MTFLKELSRFQPSAVWQSPVYPSVAAGFPSPAEDYFEPALNMQDLLVKHPISTYFGRVDGHSMSGAGINDGDILIVDRSLEPASGKIAVLRIDAEFTVKRVIKKGRKLFLVPENDQFTPLELTEEMDFEVWGMVTNVIHPV